MPVGIGEDFAGYRIIRLLGSGGMGEVYLAQHPRLPRRDALKLLPKEWSSDPDYRSRFNREADLASTLWHPHIVGVHDRGEHDEQLWISMDFVDGRDLSDLLSHKYPAGMPPDQVMVIVSAIANALDYAHNRGLLHRDVKPANIMLAEQDEGDQRVVLTDFGIARNLDEISGLTTTNMTVGTVAYSAPEQLMGEDINGRTDQYALAATAYHLLTGQQLFPHSNPAVVIGRHINSPPPALADTHAELAELDQILFKALAKNPDGRYDRCSDFANALAGEPTRARVTVSPTAVTRSAPVSQPKAMPGATLRNLHGSSRRRSWFAPAVVAMTMALLLVSILIWRAWSTNDSPTSDLPRNSSDAFPPAAFIPEPPGEAVLDGLYQLEYNNPRATLNGEPWALAGDQVKSYWWAFRSTCTRTGCVATSTRMDNVNHARRYEGAGGGTGVSRFVDGQWRSTETTGSLACGNEPNVAGAQTVSTTLSLKPQPDGRLIGSQTSTIASNECGLLGGVISVPVNATRVGDVPSGDNVDNRATVGEPPPTVQKHPPTPIPPPEPSNTTVVPSKTAPAQSPSVPQSAPQQPSVNLESACSNPEWRNSTGAEGDRMCGAPNPYG